MIFTPTTLIFLDCYHIFTWRSPRSSYSKVSEKHAKSAEAMGADALMVTGHEAAAHGGDVTSLVLVPCIADKVKIPGLEQQHILRSLHITSTLTIL